MVGWNILFINQERFCDEEIHLRNTTEVISVFIQLIGRLILQKIYYVLHTATALQLVLHDFIAMSQHIDNRTRSCE